MRFPFLVFCLLSLALSCAPPAITSDHIMFPMDPRVDPQPKKKLRVDFSSQIATELPGFNQKLLEKTRQRYNNSDLEYHYSAIPIESMISVSFLKLNLTGKSFNWGVSVQAFSGFPSIDVTFRLPDSYYISAAAYLHGFDGMIQKRMAWNGSEGYAMGFYARYRLHPFYYDTSPWSCQNHVCSRPSAHGAVEAIPSLFAGIRFKKFKAGKRERRKIENSPITLAGLRYWRSNLAKQAKWGKGDRALNLTAGYNITFSAPAVQISWTY